MRRYTSSSKVSEYELFWEQRLFKTKRNVFTALCFELLHDKNEGLTVMHRLRICHNFDVDVSNLHLKEKNVMVKQAIQLLIYVFCTFPLVQRS